MGQLVGIFLTLSFLAIPFIALNRAYKAEEKIEELEKRIIELEKKCLNEMHTFSFLF